MCQMVDATFLRKGGAAAAAVCPVGYFCADKSTAPMLCPQGRVTVGR